MISDQITYEQAMNIMLSERTIILDNLANKMDIENNLNYARMIRESSNKKEAINVIKSELLRSDTVQYYNYSKTQSYSGNSSFKASVNATIIILNDYNNHKTITGVSGSVWSRREAGLYICNWIEGNAWDEVSYDYKSIIIYASGYFEVETNASLSGGIPGFEISGSVGTSTLYQSNTMDIQGSYGVN